MLAIGGDSSRTLAATMNDAENPYGAPQSGGGPKVESGQPLRAGRATLFSWIGAFAFNLLVPLMIGWSITRGAARLGLIAACLVLLVGGGWLCYVRPALARKTIAGALVTGVSQVFPLLQFLVGAVIIRILSKVGLGEGPLPLMSFTAAGGFLATFLVGAILIAVAAGIGAVCPPLLPERWFTPSESQPDRRTSTNDL